MKRPWMPLYIADYLADTAHLSAAEHGAYLLLIMHYWRKGGLPDDDAQLARIARMSPEEWSKVRPIIEAFFEPGWTHKRIEKELAEVKQRTEAGRKGGLTTQRKRSLDAEDQATVKRSPKQKSSEPPSDPASTTVIVTVEGERREQGVGGSEDTRGRGCKNDAEFEQWYGGYPHKVGKAAARKSFFAARSSGVELETLIRARDRYIGTKPPDRPWCNPATWLNQERWLDEPAQVDLRAAARPPPAHGFAGVARTLMEPGQ